MDGAGDGASAVIWRGNAGKLTCLKRFPENASLGWFYGNVTEALGWRHGDGQGKTMGLAAYGDPARAKGALAPFHPKFSVGELVEPHEFGPSSDYNDCGSYHFHFDQANVIHKLVAAHDRENIAAAAQEILAEQAGNLIYPWLEKENTRYLSCAGGIFLNVKLNQRIRESGKVDFLHLFPNAGDGGLAVGAALYAYYAGNPDAPFFPLRHVYWGPEYSNDDIQQALVSRGLPVRYEADVARLAARLLAENKTVGWFQGRMESGPRALGGRSILMSPLVAQNKDVLNARVKFREPFRPFCPSISAKAAGTYLQHARLERFMITSFDASVSKRAAIPAVVHVDGTVRPQTVEPDVNPLYHRLLEEFAALTGESILLNTSFNVQGEPIICRPRDAIGCFFDSGLDFFSHGQLRSCKALAANAQSAKFGRCL
jgi:carbamoyltransferase